MAVKQIIKSFIPISFKNYKSRIYNKLRGRLICFHYHIPISPELNKPQLSEFSWFKILFIERNSESIFKLNCNTCLNLTPLNNKKSNSIFFSFK